MERYLITGISGFIGSHTARKMLQEGKRIRGLVRQTSHLNRIGDLDIELVNGDITRPETLKAVLRGVTKVIHAAGKTRADIIDRTEKLFTL